MKTSKLSNYQIDKIVKSVLLEEENGESKTSKKEKKS